MCNHNASPTARTHKNFLATPSLCTAAALAIIFSTAASAEEERVWSDSSGKYTRKATFLRLEDGTVFLKAADGSDFKIPLSRLSAADQEYAAAAASDAAAKDPFAVVGEMPPKADGPTNSEPSDGNRQYLVERASADDPTLKKVFAEGVGKDVDKAKKNAYREAVRQVVGAYVDAENIAVNSKLIEDRITMLSSAYVERSGPPEIDQTEDGLIRVRLLAYVRQTKVLDVLRENKVTVNVSNDSLVAEFSTKTDQQEAQQDIMSRVFRGYPSECFIASIQGAPRVNKKTDGSAELIVRLLIEPDIERFKKLSDQIHTALSAQNRVSGSFASDGKKHYPNLNLKDFVERELFGHDEDYPGMYSMFPQSERKRLFEATADKVKCSLLDVPKVYSLWNGGGGQGIYSLKYGEWEKLRDNQERPHKTRILVVLAKSMANHQRTTWRWYAVSADEANMWLPAACFPLTLSISGKSESGEDVLEDSFDLMHLGLQWDDVSSVGNHVFCLAPFFVNEEMEYYVPAFTYHRAIPASEEEISQLKTLTCSVANGERPMKVWGIND